MAKFGTNRSGPLAPTQRAPLAFDHRFVPNLRGYPGIPISRRAVGCFGVKKLAIKDVAELTGVAAATIRIWEQRYGFPAPARTASGYRIYTEQDVLAIRRAA